MPKFQNFFFFKKLFLIVVKYIQHKNLPSNQIFLIYSSFVHIIFCLECEQFSSLWMTLMHLGQRNFLLSSLLQLLCVLLPATVLKIFTPLEWSLLTEWEGREVVDLSSLCFPHTMSVKPEVHQLLLSLWSLHASSSGCMYGKA